MRTVEALWGVKRKVKMKTFFNLKIELKTFKK